MQIGAEHETLHKLDDVYKLNEKKEFYDLFEEMSEQAKKIKNFKIFYFIAEDNYLGDNRGGHPEDNSEEFFASFVHTLMYMHLLEPNLKKIKREEALLILDAYKKILNVLIAISQPKLGVIFKQALYYVQNKVNI